MQLHSVILLLTSLFEEGASNVASAKIACSYCQHVDNYWLQRKHQPACHRWNRGLGANERRRGPRGFAGWRTWW